MPNDYIVKYYYTSCDGTTSSSIVAVSLTSKYQNMTQQIQACFGKKWACQGKLLRYIIWCDNKQQLVSLLFH